ncbi:LCP family protein [Cyanobium sp. HWJ4-Hawea]|uniref:LCP family protein n=1 Tax=Cyanobium sp. HWJ4-Hawea TaxID=2823713 RepID=UPI0020CE2D6C|nr:LCP family protein [Cyanobium sp. HWJ4-Hawea]MCP9808128.1 LCP family protein [Cyanobium sp. HWJ4-Hawea]
MTQAQPRPPRRREFDREIRREERREERRGERRVSGQGSSQRREKPSAQQKKQKNQPARRRGSPLKPFAVGIAVGWALAGPLPHLAGGAVAALLHGPQSLGALINPFGLGDRRILVMGADKVAGNTDVMFTVQIKDGKTQLTQVPRDTFVESQEYGVLKANALLNYGGIKGVKQELSNLLQVPVDRYVSVDMRAIKRLGDALGGVEVNVPKRMYYVDNSQGLYIDLYPGTQLLKGDQLEGFLRFRHDEMGDLGRMERQKLVLAELFKKLGQPSTLAQLPGLLKIAGSDVKTDLSALEMGQLVTAMAGTKLTTNQLPGRIFWQNDLSYWMPDANNHYTGVDGPAPGP